LPRREAFEILYHLNCENLCSDFQEDLRFARPLSLTNTYLLCKGVFRIRIRITFDSWIRIGIADPVSGYSTFTHTGNFHISPSFFEDKLMLPPVLPKDEKKSKYSVVIQLTTWIRISIEIFG
jgi:hypothetical protein